MIFHVNPDWWKQIFDDVYLLTDARSVCDQDVTKKEVDFIQAALALDCSVPILDLCGGQGRHACELARRGCAHVVVLDYSDYLIRLGRQSAAEQKLNIVFVQGDARDTRLQPDSYGCVLIMGGSFGYFVHDEENTKILQETFRILQPGGSFLLDVPDKEYVCTHFQPVSTHQGEDGALRITRRRKLEQDVMYCQETVTYSPKGCLRENTYCIRLYSREDIRDMLQRVGFRDIFFQEDFMDRRHKGDFGTMTNRMVVKARK